MRLSIFAACLSLLAVPALAQGPVEHPRAGDIYEIRIERLSSWRSTSQSRGSSTDRDGYVERVIAVTDEGLELEYDLPGNIPDEARRDNWQFPVRVLKPQHGPLQLLNRHELETRVDRWLADAEITREACGKWIFTWDAFQIVCDPIAVLGFIEGFDLPADLHDGSIYRDANALEDARVTQAAGSERTFIAEMRVDPESVRRGLVEQDVVVAQIMGRELTREAAVQVHSADKISGTITTTFDTNDVGEAWRRETVSEIQVIDTEGVTETRTTTQTVERRPATGNTPARPPAPPEPTDDGLI